MTMSSGEVACWATLQDVETGDKDDSDTDSDSDGDNSNGEVGEQDGVVGVS